jgi:hypothetical protein
VEPILEMYLTNVSVHSRVLSEILSAKFTLVWLLSRVDVDMVPKTTRIVERPRAEGTSISNSVCMNIQMKMQVRCASYSSTAHGAGEWSESDVVAAALFQRVLLEIALAYGTPYE